jgi:serine/threonine protein kinase/lipopolysaccharide biosynthesis regulator YciM
MSEDHHDDDKTRSFVALTKGTEIGHYKIISKIGAGGMGEVYLAEDTELDRMVALKFLPSHLCRDEDCRARFKREAKAAARFDHSNIATVHEVSEHKGRPYIVMQYVGESSLCDIVAGQKLKLNEVIELVTGVAEGLEAAHQADIVHRDIKPANILIDNSGKPKLVDFGLAHVAGASKLTETGSTMGTLHYMSPEQAEGRPMDARSDLFSFGVVLYEMITGKRPFTGDYPQAITHSIINDETEPLARYKSGIPDDLQRIVSKLLTKDPSMRYQTAADLLADLKSLAISGISAPTLKAKAFSSKPMKIGLPVFVTIIIVAAAIIIVKSLGSEQGADNNDNRHSIGVVYFENLTRDPELNWLERGVPELLSTGLALSRELYVLDGQRFYDIMYEMGIKDRDSLNASHAGEVARRAGLKSMVTGNVFKAGEIFRLQVKLVDCESGELMRVEQIDGRSADDLMSMVAEATRKIRGALEIASLAQEMNELTIKRVTTSSIDAYRYFIDGVEHYSRFDWAKATPYFEKAVEEDSNFMKAWLVLADCYRSSGNYEKSQECFIQAKKLRSNAPYEEQLMIDAYDLWLQRNVPAHLEIIEKLLKYDPESTLWTFMKAQALRDLNQYDSAITIYRSLVDRKSRWPHTYSQLATLYLSRSQREEALEIYRAGVEADPGMLLSIGILAGFAELDGDSIAAKQYYKQFADQALAQGIDPISQYMEVAWHGQKYGRLSNDLYRISIQIAKHIFELDSTAYMAHYYMGLSQAALGDTANAIESLNELRANLQDSLSIERTTKIIERLRDGR